ncbi:RrF2 family transcriptional regulator [Streptomyces stramineus]
MRLTKSTDIALRMIMRLAVTAGEEAPTTREVAGAVGVPFTHAAKIASRLQHLGVVEARRGRGGGLTLTAAGRAGSIGRLVRELEGSGTWWAARTSHHAPCGTPAGCAARCARPRRRSTRRSTRSRSRT